MIKKLLLTFSFIALITVAFSGTTYAVQEGEKIVISEELTKLNDLYKEGIITEEEFSKAKSILLNSDSNQLKIEKKKNKNKKKKKLTAVERRELKEAEENRLREERKQLIAEKKAFKEASDEEKERLLEEKRKACLDPETKAKTLGCSWMKTKNAFTFWK